MATAFESMNLRPELVAACRKQGFRHATPIQSLVMPAVSKGADVMVEAATGSGKTLAYGLPLLQREPTQPRYPEVLIVAPTRELAEQICASLTRTAGTLARKVVAVTGRGGLDRQKARLDEGATLVVGTIGRIEELLKRKILVLDQVRTLVLDEVDELLLGGASAQLAALLKMMPHPRQVLLFSATMSASVEDVARGFMRDPQRLRLSAAREIPVELTHQILRTTVKRRVADLAEYLRAEKPYQCLLFCGTRHEVEEVQEALTELGLEAEYLHGEMSATKRRRLVDTFREGNLPILVASDLAARGLDLPGVDLVVNYSLPDGMAAYVHRAGRTGRAGKPGTVLSMLIEQQRERYLQLKQTFDFRVVDVRGGRAVELEIKTREERDLEYRRLPRRPAPGTTLAPLETADVRQEPRSSPSGKRRRR